MTQLIKVTHLLTAIYLLILLMNVQVVIAEGTKWFILQSEQLVYPNYCNSIVYV